LVPPPGAGSGACGHSARTLIGFLEEIKGDRNGVAANLADFEQECAAQAGDYDGAYLGWANADGTSGTPGTSGTSGTSGTGQGW
jgi:hypothetical protein